MPAILTATDFSEAGNSASQYACHLAAQLGCTLTVLHTYMLPIATADQPYPLISVNDMESIAKERMDVVLTDLRASCPNVSIDYHINYGDWRDNAEEDIANYMLIVVGNGNNDSWLGSNTLDAARSFGKPLLAVPLDTTYKNINTICLACDAASMHDLSPLQSIIPILDATGANLVMVHVKTDDNDVAAWDNPAIATALGGHSFTCHDVSPGNSNVDDAIHEFAIANNADWLAVIPHHHSFFHNLFGKSHTRAALKMGDLPVLSLH